MRDPNDVDIRGEDYIGDAGTWERACRHIALLLWWAAERELASETHVARKARAAPTKYFIGACDTKLLRRDLSNEGAAFLVDSYGAYLTELGRYAKARRVEAASRAVLKFEGGGSTGPDRKIGVLDPKGTANEKHCHEEARRPRQDRPSARFRSDGRGSRLVA